MERLLELYRSWVGLTPVLTERLAGAGSNRVYYRLTGRNASETAVGVVGTSVDENRAFIALSRHFSAMHLPVPRVLAVSGDELCYLQDDLGSTSLFDALSNGRQKGGIYDAHERELLHQAIRLLPHVQVEGAVGLDFSVCYPQPSFDETGVMFDLNYFKYCFLKPSGVDFHELHLEADFRRLAQDLTTDEAAFFLYRDFQSRNVMLVNKGADGVNDVRPYLIDFQGGRRGSLYYDLASFLWQASARYDDSLRNELVDAYLDELAKIKSDVPSPNEFKERLRLYVFFRTIQVLGAYGYRGYFERKPHFLNSIPAAIGNLRELLGHGVAQTYPHLCSVLQSLVDGIPAENAAERKPSSLTVRVFSFSYKKGIPEDETGNGGGYVFDCRSTHNPGRYEPYKNLTGLDAPVIRFLEEDGEILAFLESVYQLADTHVERYIERGFTSLMFAFGCTGGQHRSVYSAQHLAEHLHKKYGIEVILCHREQQVVSHFPRVAPPSVGDGTAERK
ncbi:MAG: phosphotransferase [Prevotella sp.]|nr:phosphotransferase [Prevotella sp.]